MFTCFVILSDQEHVFSDSWIDNFKIMDAFISIFFCSHTGGWVITAELSILKMAVSMKPSSSLSTSRPEPASCDTLATETKKSRHLSTFSHLRQREPLALQLILMWCLKLTIAWRWKLYSKCLCLNMMIVCFWATLLEAKNKPILG